MERPEVELAGMELAEVELAEDGVRALFDGAEREAPRQRALWQVLVVVLGWAVVLVILCVALLVAAPAIEALVIGIARAVVAAGSAS